jgi:hypothetical protein
MKTVWRFFKHFHRKNYSMILKSHYLKEDRPTSFYKDMLTAALFTTTKVETTKVSIDQ